MTGRSMQKALRGAASGFVGTVALTALRETLSWMGVVEITAPDQVVERLEDFTGELEPNLRRLLVLAAHFGYGTIAGAAFGMMLNREPASPGTEAATGAALGVLAWGAGWAGWLWMLGVHGAPWEQRSAKVLLPVIDHAFYGAVWGLLYRAWRPDRPAS